MYSFRINSCTGSEYIYVQFHFRIYSCTISRYIHAQFQDIFMNSVQNAKAVYGLLKKKANINVIIIIT